MYETVLLTHLRQQQGRILLSARYQTWDTLYTVQKTSQKGIYAVKSQCVLLPSSVELLLGIRTVCAYTTRLFVQPGKRKRHSGLVIYVHVHILMAVHVFVASNSKSGGCLPDSPTDDPLHGCGVSDKNINQEAVGLPDVFLPQYRLCWLALFGVQSVHSQMDRTVFA